MKFNLIAVGIAGFVAVTQAQSLPDKVYGGYIRVSESSGSGPVAMNFDDPQLANLNTVWIFHASPVGYGGVELIPSSEFGGSMQNLKAGIDKLKVRGTRVILSVGGADAGMNFPDDTYRNNCLQGLITIITALGGVDGIDWNTFEQSGFNQQKAARMMYVTQGVKNHFNKPDFFVTFPPSVQNGQKELDVQFHTAFRNAGWPVVTFPQFYDGGNDNNWLISSQPTSFWMNYMSPSEFGLGMMPQNLTPQNHLDLWINGNTNYRGIFRFDVALDKSLGYPHAMTVGQYFKDNYPSSYGGGNTGGNTAGRGPDNMVMYTGTGYYGAGQATEQTVRSDSCYNLKECLPNQTAIESAWWGGHSALDAELWDVVFYELPQCDGFMVGIPLSDGVVPSFSTYGLQNDISSFALRPKSYINGIYGDRAHSVFSQDNVIQCDGIDPFIPSHGSDNMVIYTGTGYYGAGQATEQTVHSNACYSFKECLPNHTAIESAWWGGHSALDTELWDVVFYELPQCDGYMVGIPLSDGVVPSFSTYGLQNAISSFALRPKSYINGAYGGRAHTGVRENAYMDGCDGFDPIIQ